MASYSDVPEPFYCDDGCRESWASDREGGLMYPSMTCPQYVYEELSEWAKSKIHFTPGSLRCIPHTVYCDDLRICRYCLNEEVIPGRAKMDPGFRQIWIEALRSGRYPQLHGRSALGMIRNSVRYYNAIAVLPIAACFRSEWIEGQLVVDGSGFSLTPAVRAAFGLSERGPYVGGIQLPFGISDVRHLSASGVSFEEIAKLIEEQL